MAKKYYLISGDSSIGYALNVPYKDTYYKLFKDISFMDDACITLGAKYKEGLKYANPGKVISAKQFIANPFNTKEEYRFYSPFDIADERINKILDSFRYFIDERQYKVNGRDRLELTRDYHLKQYIIYLLNQIYNLDYRYFDQLISYDSTISKNLKSLIYQKNTAYRGISVEEYYDRNSKMFMNHLSSYTELRNATLMLIKAKLHHTIGDNSELNKKRYSDLRELTEEDPASIKECIDDYYRVVESKKNKTFVSPQEKYHQITLAEYFGDRGIQK